MKQALIISPLLWAACTLGAWAQSDSSVVTKNNAKSWLPKISGTVRAKAEYQPLRRHVR